MNHALKFAYSLQLGLFSCVVKQRFQRRLVCFLCMNSINSGCVNAARQKCVFRQQKYQLLKAHIFSPQHTSISTDGQAVDTVASTLAADMQEDWQSRL